MPNYEGRNQYDAKNYPSPEELKAAFDGYAKENSGSGLTWKDQIVRLQLDFGLTVGKTKLYELRRLAGIETVRSSMKSTSAQERVQAVIDLKESDVLGKWGVQQTRQRLANKGILIARDELRTILHDHFDAEFVRRFVGKRKELIPRSPLDCLGPFHQLHCDGHEKLNAQALKMGDISLPIYSYKDQFSSLNPYLVTAPNIRQEVVVGHIYLDLIVAVGGYIPIQLVMDKGSETGLMRDFHTELRLHHAPEFTAEEWPPYIQVQSKHNTPIEGFWRWVRDGEGSSFREVVLEGYNAGRINPQDQRQVNVFYWLFAPLLQERLDEFSEYWNNHRLSKQSKKVLPSGRSPKHIFLAPETACETARHCAIRVSLEKVAELRSRIGGDEGRIQALEYISREEHAAIDEVYLQLGSPGITLSSAWDVFTNVFRLYATMI